MRDSIDALDKRHRILACGLDGFNALRRQGLEFVKVLLLLINESARIENLPPLVLDDPLALLLRLVEQDLLVLARCALFSLVLQLLELLCARVILAPASGVVNVPLLLLLPVSAPHFDLRMPRLVDRPCERRPLLSEDAKALVLEPPSLSDLVFETVVLLLVELCESAHALLDELVPSALLGFLDLLHLSVLADFEVGLRLRVRRNFRILSCLLLGLLRLKLAQLFVGVNHGILALAGMLLLSPLVFSGLLLGSSRCGKNRLTLSFFLAQLIDLALFDSLELLVLHLLHVERLLEPRVAFGVFALLHPLCIFALHDKELSFPVRFGLLDLLAQLDLLVADVQAVAEQFSARKALHLVSLAVNRFRCHFDFRLALFRAPGVFFFVQALTLGFLSA
mmetsp:Transcript_18189/g.58006  ORF Transcript_18189/g.58006 Transcript_18189/m.58006 type:complete len:394 (+) Transcript_18189:91-1272(+)